MPTLRTSVILVVWVVVLVVIAYVCVLLRYHYRVHDTVTILQCTTDTFHTELLRERQPLVVRGFADTGVYTSLHARPIPHDDVHRRLQHITPWFCGAQPVRVHTSDVKHAQSIADARLLVQLRGSCTVRLSPHKTGRADDDANEPMDTAVDIVLHAGDGVFVPYLWWVSVLCGDDDNSPNEIADVQWHNYVTSYVTKGMHSWTAAAPV